MRQKTRNETEPRNDKWCTKWNNPPSPPILSISFFKLNYPPFHICNVIRRKKEKNPYNQEKHAKKPDGKWLPPDPQSAEEQPLLEARNQKDESATFNYKHTEEELEKTKTTRKKTAPWYHWTFYIIINKITQPYRC